MAFRVGQKVVCVNGDNYGDQVGMYPKEGDIYTVFWVGIWGDSMNEPSECVHLAEIDRPECCEGYVVPYCASRFRPVVEHKTDISIFTAMLTPSKQTVDVP